MFYNQFLISVCIYKVIFMTPVTRKVSSVLHVLVWDKKFVFCMQMIVFIIHFQLDFCVCSLSNIDMSSTNIGLLMVFSVFINSKLLHVVYSLLPF